MTYRMIALSSAAYWVCSVVAWAAFQYGKDTPRPFDWGVALAGWIGLLMVSFANRYDRARRLRRGQPDKQ